MTSALLTTRPDYEALPLDPLKVLACLPAMGRLMIAANRDGATHERIGPVEFVTPVREAIRCRGSAHDAVIDPSAIGSIIIDRTGKMKDRVLPRIDFLGTQSDILFGVVGLEGLEPFDAALAGLDGTALAERAREERKTFPDNLNEDDPGFAPLHEAVAAAAPVTIELNRPGISQSWYGVIAQVKPAMGFGNVMTGDFHLHLRAGTVSGWKPSTMTQEGQIELRALGLDGTETGLALRGPRGAFRSFG